MDNHPDADWLVVYSAWPETDFHTEIPKERRIFVAGEPESFHVYQPNFLNQFGTVLTTQTGCQLPQAIHSQVGINWFAGVRFLDSAERFKATLSFADFERGNPVKTKLCSVVSSNQTVTKGHRERLAFVNALKEAFGNRIDYFGRGSRTMADKDEALAEYKYHIALENSLHKDYWTEKLADPFLRGCYPIYSGCKNVHDYFPDNSLTRIDTGRPYESVEIIRKVLDQELNQNQIDAMALAKEKVLHEYNIFAVLEKMLDGPLGGTVQKTLNRSNEQIFSDHEVKNRRLGRRINRYFKSLFASQ